VEGIKGLVSVVLPVREWRDETSLAIHSMLVQSYRNIELLLVGQSSLHSLITGLRNAHIRDERIRLVSRHSHGIVSALKPGLHVARGEFHARLDDDDLA